ncbi:MAG: hypothetical protein KC729_05040 [Candidatus Eisenbacteria bacterium]|uniref:Uncharacterized protein n=1 Tax=Eiseniibacteriota bacterium TaxID=2212470 RepID=A0A956LXC6_UNCEI|nr:hypothetical protein [Candidatus Eisenbacteria bacterium]
MNHNLWWVALAILIVNLPFGYWRSGVRKFSPAWFIAIHAPVPIVAGIRILAGVGWHLTTLPVLLGAYFTGQFLGNAWGKRAGRVPDPSRREKIPDGPEAS